MIRTGLRDAIDDRSGNFHGYLVELAFHSVGTVVAGTSLDGLNFGTGNEVQNFARLGSDILHALMAGYVIRDGSKFLDEIFFKQALCVSQYQIFEWIIYRLFDLDHIWIVRKH
jgi:hypothetical protein